MDITEKRITYRVESIGEFNDTIVIVEDNETIAKMIANSLSSEGFKTKVIPYGRSAIIYVLQNPNCMLLMEYILPDITAKDIVNSLKSSNVDVPYIIMSSPGNENIIIEMMKLGARDYLVKEHGFMDLLPTAVKKVVNQLTVENRLIKAESDLRSSEFKFHDIFNSLTDAVYIYTLDGVLLELNEEGAKRLNIDRKKVFNVNYLDYQTHKFRANYAHFIDSLKLRDKIVYQTRDCLGSDKEMPVECIARIIDYDKIKAVLTIARDISDREEAELLLRQSEERFQRITEVMTDYIFTVNIKDNKPWKTIHNSACIEVTGFTPDEFEQEQFLWFEMIHELDKEMVLSNINKILSGEQIKPFEHRIIRKDKTIAWLKNTPVLHFNANNELISYDGVIQDVTMQKEVEEMLLESQARLTAIIAAFGGFIYVCSPDRKIEYINEKFIAKTGYDPTGDFCYKALYERDDVCPWCVQKQVQRGETVKWELDSPIDKRWYSMISTPIFHNDGTISKQTLIVDITDKKNADNTIAKLNNLYFSLIDELTLPVCHFDNEAKIISANRAFYDAMMTFNPKLKTEENSLQSTLPPELLRWTDSNIKDINDSNRAITTPLKSLFKKTMFNQDMNWIVKGIFDSDNRVVEYQGLLIDNKKCQPELFLLEKES